MTMTEICSVLQVFWYRAVQDFIETLKFFPAVKIELQSCMHIITNMRGRGQRYIPNSPDASSSVE